MQEPTEKPQKKFVGQSSESYAWTSKKTVEQSAYIKDQVAEQTVHFKELTTYIKHANLPVKFSH